MVVSALRSRNHNNTGCATPSACLESSHNIFLLRLFKIRKTGPSFFFLRKQKSLFIISYKCKYQGHLQTNFLYIYANMLMLYTERYIVVYISYLFVVFGCVLHPLSLIWCFPGSNLHVNFIRLLVQYKIKFIYFWYNTCLVFLPLKLPIMAFIAYLAPSCRETSNQAERTENTPKQAQTPPSNRYEIHTTMYLSVCNINMVA